MKSNWTIEKRPRAIYLKLRKEWDLDRVNEFSTFISRELEPGRYRHFVVDLSEVEYIDSMALGVLINLKNKYKTEGGHVLLLSPSPTVEKILKQSGLFKIFPVFYTDAEVEKHLVSINSEPISTQF